MTLTNLNILTKEHHKLWCVVFQNPTDFNIDESTIPDVRICCAKWNGSRPIIEKYNLSSPCILKFENGNLTEITPMKK